jgi:HEAT repeat protein
MLVAASAAFLSVIQYRQSVYDPTFARIRRVQYADVAGKTAAIRELMEAEESKPNVVETLLNALRDPDPSVRALAAQALADAVFRTTFGRGTEEVYAGAVKAALTEALRDRDPAVCVRAASGLSLLREQSEQSFAILLRTARTPAATPLTIGDIDDRFRALGDLAECYRDKSETVPAILAAMAEHDARVRKQGVIALNLYLRSSNLLTEPIVNALLARLDDDDDSIRGEAGQVLSRMGRKVAARAVPVLIRNLNTPRSAIRVATAKALGTFGLDAESARPTLRALDERSGDARVRKTAHEALVAIEKACRTFDAETLPELIADLGNEDASVRADAAADLVQYGTRAKAAVPALNKALRDPHPKVRRAAAAALDATEAPQGRSGHSREQ